MSHFHPLYCGNEIVRTDSRMRDIKTCMGYSRSSEKDMLATRSEELKMKEHESIGDFSSKFISLAQEAITLGKKYKEKLMKKFMRCVPSKYMAYKTAVSISLNTYEMCFDEVVGMLQAHEMERTGRNKMKGVAFA